MAVFLSRPDTEELAKEYVSLLCETGKWFAIQLVIDSKFVSEEYHSRYNGFQAKRESLIREARKKPRLDEIRAREKGKRIPWTLEEKLILQAAKVARKIADKELPKAVEDKLIEKLDSARDRCCAVDRSSIFWSRGARTSQHRYLLRSICCLLDRLSSAT